MPDETHAPFLAGALSGFALADVLQLLELGGRSGVLVVDGGPRGGGCIRLRRGRVLGVSTGTSEAATAGEHAAAVATLLELPAGHWAFHTTTDASGSGGARTAAEDEGTRVSAILVEAARRRDERTRADRATPPDADVPALAASNVERRDRAAGRRLTAADLQVLAAVDGVRDARAIAAVARCDVARVRDTLAVLRAVGVVRPRGECAGTGSAA